MNTNLSHTPYNIFVACPYKLYDRYDLKTDFERVGSRFGVRFVFAKDVIGNSMVLSKVREMIDEADYVVCDITSWNPNVTLELGYAMGTGKEWIILFNPSYRRSIFGGATDLPTDLKGMDQIQWRSNKELEVGLDRWLSQMNKREIDLTDRRLSATSRIEDLVKRHHEGVTTEQVSRMVCEPYPTVLAVLRQLAHERKILYRGGNRFRRWLPPVEPPSTQS